MNLLYISAIRQRIVTLVTPENQGGAGCGWKWHPAWAHAGSGYRIQLILLLSTAAKQMDCPDVRGAFYRKAIPCLLARGVDLPCRMCSVMFAVWTMKHISLIIKSLASMPCGWLNIWKQHISRRKEYFEIWIYSEFFWPVCHRMVLRDNAGRHLEDRSPLSAWLLTV